MLCAVFALMFMVKANAAQLGDATPDCSPVALADAQPLPLKKFQGDVVYVDFWASWCGPCAKSFPFLNTLHEQYKAQGLKIVGVNMDENTDDALGFLAKIPAKFVIATDRQAQCAQQFDVKAMPSSYLVDRKGMIRHIHLGFRPDEAGQIKDLVEKLLAER